MNRNRSLPEEVWMEIIVLLPVKSLISLKCVSKFWYAFIQSPNFVSFHYHNPFNRPKLLVCHRIKFDPPPVQSVRPSEKSTLRRDHRMQGFSMFPGEFTDVGGRRRDICDRVTEFEDKRSFIVVGPVEGLFMFHKCDTNEVGIWNPATAEFKQLPKPNLSIMFECDDHLVSRNVFGFGLNPLTNEYKVVCTPYDDYRLCETSTFIKGAVVCMIGGDGGCFWRDIDGPELGRRWRIVGGSEIKSDATYSNGCYYWLSTYRCKKCGDFGQYKLVVFDMRTDVFTEMTTPPYLNHDNNNCSNSDVSSRVKNVVNLSLHGDDDIALLVTQHKYQRVYNRWVYGPPISASVSIMKNEAEENWIKVYSHKLAPKICKELRLPLGIWKNNGIFFLNEIGRLLLYANASEEIVDLGVNKDDFEGHFYLMVYNYKKSLVSFGGQTKHSVFQDYFA